MIIINRIKRKLGMPITLSEAERAILKVIKGNENHVSICRYVDRGKPCCLIGRALYRLGIPMIGLLRIELLSIASASARYQVPMTEDAQILLGMAQTLQDKGHKWGEVREIMVKEQWGLSSRTS